MQEFQVLDKVRPVGVSRPYPNDSSMECVEAIAEKRLFTLIAPSLAICIDLLLEIFVSCTVAGRQVSLAKQVS